MIIKIELSSGETVEVFADKISAFYPTRGLNLERRWEILVDGYLFDIKNEEEFNRVKQQILRWLGLISSEN
jgi:hypothetical protein